MMIAARKKERMTITINLPVETERENASEDSFHHLVCECDETIGLCGTKVDDTPIIAYTPDNNCIVCEDLDKIGCPRCGE